MDRKDILFDIRRSMTFRHIRLTVLSALWYIALYISVTGFKHYYFIKGIPPSNLWLFIIIFIVAPFLYFKIYRIFTEHSYEGVITEVQTVYRPKIVNGRFFKTLECCDIAVRSKHGVTYHYSYVDYSETGDYYHYYHIGDHVYHYKFMSVIYNIDNNDSFSTICVNCGCLDLQDRQTCFKCGFTLIKNKKD